jgi:hypothetical protein
MHVINDKLELLIQQMNGFKLSIKMYITDLY